MRVTITSAVVSAAVALFAAVPAHADWSGKGEAGLVIASGKTDTKTANADTKTVTATGAAKITGEPKAVTGTMSATNGAAHGTARTPRS